MRGQTKLILGSIALGSGLLGLCSLATLFNSAVGGCLFAIASDNSCNTVFTNTFESTGTNDALVLVGALVCALVIFIAWPKHSA